ncbi:MAG: PepSY domain-containing protein [Bacteroides sp.]|nr:PepSY domain-containing protein [Bacillota bacterium]MCM1394259.1 PepSY domain-containing protein [[Eubacterium] siraeum]MCM1455758.1 PepSY domain-containing protein [Bacteroides sp.]
MKKKIYLVLTLILVFICVFALVACNKPQEKANDNVSRRTDAYFAGESETFAVSVEKGRRERTFIADGKATDVVDFCQITVIPLKSNDYESINFVINGDDTTLSGEITASDFGEYSATVELGFTPKSVTVTAGSDTSEIDLTDMLEGKLTAQDAINIAKEAFKDKLTAESEEGKAEREVYVKLITGDRTSYYYYVSFIGDGADYLAALIDPSTGDIVSKR